MENGSRPGDDTSVNPTRRHNQLPLSSSQNVAGAGEFSCFYSPNSPSRHTVQMPDFFSVIPSPPYSDDENLNSTDTRLYLAYLALQNHETEEKYGVCVSQLNELAQENQNLRRENSRLRLANIDLTKRLGLSPSPGPPVSSPASSIANEFGRLNIGGSGQSPEFGRLNIGSSGPSPELGRLSIGGSGQSPTSVLGFVENRFERTNLERVSLPKSISIRSTGFLNVGQGGSNSGGSSCGNRLRAVSPANVGLVYVPGGKKEEPVELEVYNQGMLKTELCNKWQETGTCPYGDHCQFAHGVGELRPVIRHPRYKTEVCRMVLAGDVCPYGHRCHFRHAITEQDRSVQ